MKTTKIILSIACLTTIFANKLTFSKEEASKISEINVIRKSLDANTKQLRKLTTRCGRLGKTTSLILAGFSGGIVALSIENRDAGIEWSTKKAKQILNEAITILRKYSETNSSAHNLEQPSEEDINNESNDDE